MAPSDAASPTEVHDAALQNFPFSRSYRVVLAAFIAIIASSLFLDEFVQSLFTYVALSSIVALGLVLLTGFAGLPSFAQAAFVGVGAYAAALLTLKAAISPWLTLPVSVAVTAFFAWAIAAVVVQLTGHYLSLATIALAVAVYFLFAGLDVTGGQNGLSSLPPLSILGYRFTSATPNMLFVWAVLLLFILLFNNLLGSRMGRAIRALKDEAPMAEAMGVNTAAAKTAVFMIAAAMAGFVGWFYTYFQRFVNPSPFSLSQGIEYLFMTIIGGANMLWGAVVGATLITLLKPLLQTRLIGLNGNFESILFGSVTILLFQFAPEGLLPRFHPLLKRLRRQGRFTPPMLPEATPARPARRRQQPALEVVGVGKAFGGVVANDDVSISVQAGEIVALIGPNGAGKSTLFNLISGIMRADRGMFLLDGQPITGLPARIIARRGLSRSFQHVRLVAEMSVLENVAIGSHARGSKGIVAAMLGLNADEESRLLAEAQKQVLRVGLGECLWLPAGTLSLGQQRMVEIARALAAAPLVLLLDEPAAGLRQQEKQALQRILYSLRTDGLAILLVEHDMDFVMTLADRVIVMENGRVIANGAPSEVQQAPAVRAAYLGTMA